jgi:hypothetical protein
LDYRLHPPGTDSGDKRLQFDFAFGDPQRDSASRHDFNEHRTGNDSTGFNVC